MRRNQQKNTAPATWLDTAEETPRDPATLHRPRHRRQRFFRIVITASAVLMPLSLLVNVLTVANSVNRTGPGADTAVVNVDARAAATLAVERWLGGADLPGGGRVVAWDGREAAPAWEVKTGDPLFEVHAFTVADGNGSTYRSEVQVAVAADGSVKSVATPSLLPVALPNLVEPQNPWAGLMTVPVPDTVETAVKAWAAAYTSGDPNTLRQVTGDEDGQHTYVPLTGVASVEVRAVTATYLPEAGQKPSTTATPSMVVRAQLLVQWTGSSAKDATTITYDLLMARAKSASPSVVAWVGPGLGPSATPFQNALTGREVLLPKPAPAAPQTQATTPEHTHDHGHEPTTEVTH